MSILPLIEFMKTNFFIIPAFFLIFLIIIDLYTYKGIRTTYNAIIPNPYYTLTLKIFWAISALIYMSVIIAFAIIKNIDLANSYKHYNLLIGIILLLYIPKLHFSFFHFIEDIITLFYKTESGRVIWITKTGLLISLLLLIILLYGMTLGKFYYKVHNYTIPFNNLPKSFNGFTIAHISDLHLGSLKGNEKQLTQAVTIINSYHPDIIIFSGDIVNNFASEAKSFISILKKLNSSKGKYAVLGNHDYGEYYVWQSDELKQKNLDEIKKIHSQIGFNLLLNEATIITQQNDSIAIVGVENWGLPPYPSHGNLQQALQSVQHIPFKILISHDPTHWEKEVTKQTTHIPLTLSGHTHGFQFGFEIGSLRWSPSKYLFKYWAGLYKKEAAYLNVNRGLGFVGYPGRIGIRPEITIITLKNSIY